MSVLELFNAGIFATNTVGDPGVHGAGKTGTHGIGVNTPNAAAVAAATVGFAMDMHVANVGILAGKLSIIFAIGMDVSVLFFGVTRNAHGAIPNEHIN